MNKSFYPRLAAQNLWKNGKLYVPYLMTIIGSAAAFYIILALSMARDLPDRVRYTYLTMFLTIGIFVLGVFIFIFLFYTNSFLMKRRKKELGLYNVLGMGKRHIAIVLSLESLYTWLMGAAGGVGLGMLLQKLVTMLVQRLIHMEAMFSFYVPVQAVLATFLYFGVILLLTLLKNLGQVHLQKPVELLRGASTGEREPRTRWLLVILGVASLGAGYYIALATDNAIAALELYFLAVLLVIIGTYCLFTAVSIAVLKALRRNKRIYYKTPNFIGISGMLHRMNRNAVGLANICILSTMVLVMVSATLSLYAGTQDALESMYPSQINFTAVYAADDDLDTALLEQKFQKAVERQGLAVTGVRSYSEAFFNMAGREDGYVLAGDEAQAGYRTNCMAVFLTADGCRGITGQSVSLEPGQLLTTAELPADGRLAFTFCGASGEVRTVSYRAEPLPGEYQLGKYDSVLPAVYFILPDDAALREIAELRQWVQGPSSFAQLYFNCGIDTSASVEEQIRCGMPLSDPEVVGLRDEIRSYSVDTREGNRQDYYITNGGFFFLGIFLGIIFLMAAVLIIYYKQISEGYEDRERYRIMRQVGLPQRDVRRSINVQMLVVFFAPLAVAGIHVAFDFRLVRMLLTLFGMLNSRLTALCTLGTFLAFALIYGLVYILTARTYYRIVSDRRPEP